MVRSSSPLPSVSASRKMTGQAAIAARCTPSRLTAMGKNASNSILRMETKPVIIRMLTTSLIFFGTIRLVAMMTAEDRTVARIIMMLMPAAARRSALGCEHKGGCHGQKRHGHSGKQTFFFHNSVSSFPDFRKCGKDFGDCRRTVFEVMVAPVMTPASAGKLSGRDLPEPLCIRTLQRFLRPGRIRYQTGSPLRRTFAMAPFASSTM